MRHGSEGWERGVGEAGSRHVLVADCDELAADAGMLGAALAVVAQAVDSAKNMPKPPHLAKFRFGLEPGLGQGWG